MLDFGSGAGRDAIRALARSLLGVEVTSNTAAVRAAAATALSSGVVASDDMVFLNDLLNLPQPPGLRPIYEAMDAGTRSRGQLDSVARILDRKSRQLPRLLVVEDLHWADPLVLTQLARLTTVVARHPALLIMTSRIEGDPLDETWRAQVSGASLTTIDLGPLPSDDARALAEALIAANTAFADRCVERAAGNPLFLDQLLRHADESHAVVVPGSIQSLVQERIGLTRLIKRLCRLPLSSASGSQARLWRTCSTGRITSPRGLRPRASDLASPGAASAGERRRLLVHARTDS